MYAVSLRVSSQEPPGAAPDGDESSRVSKTVDVLIKAVRVVANLSINETIGSRIAATDQCVMLLLQILGTIARRPDALFPANAHYVTGYSVNIWCEFSSLSWYYVLIIQALGRQCRVVKTASGRCGSDSTMW